ncbi:hypothetical protein [Dongia sp.]|uniref:hypothetical protein n=1 Tax=Dongia sp. TaxID=1977262 RepID=UPI0035B2BB9A
MTWPLGTIGDGGNSGFQLLNTVLQFGMRRIVLVGFDLHDREGVHWHGNHPPVLTNPASANLARWRRVLDAQASLLDGIGAEVTVVGLGSALTAYAKVGSIADAIERG